MRQSASGTETRPISQEAEKGQAWLRAIEQEREQAEGLLEWVTRKLAAAEAAERLGRAWQRGRHIKPWLPLARPRPPGHPTSPHQNAASRPKFAPGNLARLRRNRGLHKPACLPGKARQPKRCHFCNIRWLLEREALRAVVRFFPVRAGVREPEKNGLCF